LFDFRCSEQDPATALLGESQGPVAHPMLRVAPARTRSRLDARLARSTRGPRGLSGLVYPADCGAGATL
jgi:hypothetical protein